MAVHPPSGRLGKQAPEIEPPRHPEPGRAGERHRDTNLRPKASFDRLEQRPAFLGVGVRLRKRQRNERHEGDAADPVGDEHNMQRAGDFDIVDHLVSSPRLRQKIALKLVRLALEFLGVGGRLALDRDIRPSIIRVQLEPFLQVWFAVGQDGLGRTFGLGCAAVNALVGMNDQHVLALVETVDRAHFYAIHVFALDAIVSDHVGLTIP
jgi:hypothetical protein